MSEKIFDNKHLIHIGAEIVVIAGISFYLSSKIKKQQSIIEELSQKLEDQEDRLQKTNRLAVDLNNGIAGYIKKNDEQVNMLINTINDLRKDLDRQSKVQVQEEKNERNERVEKKERNEPETVSKKEKNVNQRKSSMKSPSATLDPLEKIFLETMKMTQIPFQMENRPKIQFSLGRNETRAKVEEIEEKKSKQENKNVSEEQNEENENEDDECQDISDSELDEEIQDELNELNDLKTKTSL